MYRLAASPRPPCFVVAAAEAGTPWWAVPLIWLAPDVALLGGLTDGRLDPRAVPVYNAVHSLAGPAILGAAAASASSPPCSRSPGSPTSPSTAPSASACGRARASSVDELSPRGEGDRRRRAGPARGGGPGGAVDAAARRAVGIKAPSIYKHVPDKRALEVAMIAAGFEERSRAVRRRPTARGPRARIWRAFALDHPHLYRLMTLRPLPRDRLPPASRPARRAGHRRRRRRRAPRPRALRVRPRHGDPGARPPLPGGTADVDAAWAAGLRASQPNVALSTAYSVRDSTRRSAREERSAVAR